MRPAFRILADGEDATARIADRLLSLSVSDEDGLDSDRAELALDDRDGRLALPPHGAALEISLGFRETGLTRIGRFIVDATAGSGPAMKLTVGAKAADMRSELRAPRSRAWEAVTLADIVAAIAGRAGLKPAVGAGIGATFYPYIAQTAESDLHLLTRLALVLDATAKPAGGRLVVVERGGETAADGTPLAPVALARGELADWRWDLADRGHYAAVSAAWQDTAGGARHTVTAGDGTPARELRRVFGSEDEARRAARAALRRTRRGEATLEGRVAGFRAALFAGGRIEVAGLRPEIDGTWHLTRVEHRLETTLATSFSAEREPREKDG